MRKIRRLLQVMLFIEFMVGIHNGMKVENLEVILINGVLVLAVIVAERKEK